MNDVFQKNDDDILIINRWTSLFDGLVAGFTTRLGGVSKGYFNSNNLGLHVNDNSADVLLNRQRLSSKLGFSFDTFTCAEQVHSNQVAIVGQNEVGRGRAQVSDTIKNADGLVTNLANTLLVSFYADCVPLLFVDPTKKVVALAHAGWKGTVGAIAEQTIHTMQSTYGCHPSSIYAAIGPSIDACCYEVDELVTKEIYRLWEAQNLDKLLLNSCVKPINEKKSYINLKEINRQIMIKAGIMSSHIEISKLCTGCSTDLFFSHRKEQGKTGRMASFIGWQERIV